jgi:hypothetical protein
MPIRSALNTQRVNLNGETCSFRNEQPTSFTSAKLATSNQTASSIIKVKKSVRFAEGVSYKISERLVNDHTAVNELKEPKTAFRISSLKLDSPFHKMANSLTVNPATYFAGSHKTKADAKMSADSLLDWAKSPTKREVVKLGPQFIEDMAAFINHKKGTHPAQADDLSKLTRQVVDSTVFRALETFPGNSSEKGHDSGISCAKPHIQKILNLAVENGVCGPNGKQFLIDNGTTGSVFFQLTKRS